MTDDLPLDHTGAPMDRALVDDLADVLYRIVTGWETTQGEALAYAPEVQRVMRRYRQSKSRPPDEPMRALESRTLSLWILATRVTHEVQSLHQEISKLLLEQNELVFLNWVAGDHAGPYIGPTEKPDPPRFVCPRCAAASYNPNDVREGYCGNCHDWTGKEQPSGPV